MMDSIGTWIRTVTGTSILCAAALVLLPNGRVKETAKIVFGFIIMFALLSVFKGWKIPDYSEALNSWKYEALDISGDIDEKNKAILRSVIEEKAEAYILDKGDAIGIRINGARVRAKWSEEGFWYPYSVELSADERSQEAEYYITSELGIASENITWKTGEISDETAG